MLSVSSAAIGYAPVTAPLRQPRADVRMETMSDLDALAQKLNPKVQCSGSGSGWSRLALPLARTLHQVGFYDPLGLSSANLWGSGEAATIGFLRHAEIKHGRIAMFAFVGYCVQANGIHWPLQLTLSGVTYEQISQAGFPSEQWDALPTLSKVQILGAISLLEVFGEASYLTEAQGEKHYMVRPL
eukprot:scaffold57547_cov63-Phaeocystis_antarctica.AAC.2